MFMLYQEKNKKKKSNVLWLRGSLKDNWSKYLKNIDVCVHLAAYGVKKEKNIKQIIKTNVLDSLEFITSAIRAGCKKFIIVSTSSEYKQNKNILTIESERYPEDYYGLSKCIFSDLVLQLSKQFKDCKFKIVRLFPVFGQNEHYKRLYPSLKKAAKDGKSFLLNRPNEIRDFTDVNFASEKLVGHCLFNKSTKNFEVFHLSSNNSMSNKKFAIYIWKKFKAKGKIKFKKNYPRYISHVSNKIKK